MKRDEIETILCTLVAYWYEDAGETPFTIRIDDLEAPIEDWADEIELRLNE
jgi:hypothetical protein